MTTPIAQVVDQTLVTNAEFVKLVVYDALNVATTHTFSSSYKNETIGGTVYLALGGLMAVGTQQRDIRVTSFDTSISLSGIGSENIYTALATRLKGSLVTIYRGFYDSNYNLVNAVQRFTGVVTSYTITEDLDIELYQDNFMVTINCSSYKTILENKIGGRQTSPNYWNEYATAPAITDSSMINVPNLHNAYFNFGKKVSR
jgi:hypothetical protein